MKEDNANLNKSVVETVEAKKTGSTDWKRK
jgi:hypothetical protein